MTERDDIAVWMDGAARRSLSALLMKAEKLVQDADSDGLDADDVETMHWCWEGINNIYSAKLAKAQLCQYRREYGPKSIDDLAEMITMMQHKIDSLEKDGEEKKTT